MPYNPESDLIGLKARGVVNSFDKTHSNPPAFGVVVDNNDLSDLYNALPDGVRIETDVDEFDCIVFGTVGIVTS